jgi:site-specific DNA recombinase
MLEIDEETGHIARLIYRWYVHGDEHGTRLSSRAITVRLSEMGATTPGERQKGYTRKRGKAMWNHEMVRHILSNELYAGTWHYGVRTTEQTKRENWESVSVDIPAIVDHATWERAQARKAQNKALANRNAKREYLLRGMIRCDLCNSAYYGTSIRDMRYYRDSWGKTHHQGLEGGCVNKSIRAEAIEADIWNEIKGLFQNLDELRDNLKAAQQNEEDTLAPIREKLQITENFIRQAERDATKIAAALPDAERGGAVYKALKKDETEVNARLDSLFKQREKLIEQLGARKLTDDAVDTIMTFARKVREGIGSATLDDKRRMLESLDVQVIVTPGRYHIKCLLGEKSGEISRIAYGGVRIVPNSP